MLTLIIGILIIVVIGAILFWVIERFCPDQRLGYILRPLVVLACLGAIVALVLPMFGIRLCSSDYRLVARANAVRNDESNPRQDRWANQSRPSRLLRSGIPGFGAPPT